MTTRVEIKNLSDNHNIIVFEQTPDGKSFNSPKLLKSGETTEVYVHSMNQVVVTEDTIEVEANS